MTLVRSDAEALAYADTLAILETPGASSASAPEWCVDLGERLITLSTFDTWTAIARGEVRAATRAWREGLECWTRVDELPELSCALTETPATPPPVMTEITVAPDSLAAFEDETRDLEADQPTRSSTTATRRVVALFGLRQRGPASFGALVAAAAILVAAFRPAGPPRGAAERRPEANRAGLEMIAKRLTVGALTSAVGGPPSEPSVAPPPSTPKAPSVRKPERGQRRQRRTAK